MSVADQSLGFQRPRLVAKKVLAKPQGEGEGAVVRRSIGRPELKSLDPFLMLDEFSVSPPAGFPDHPHRGFETVTYVLQGGITHQDFAGHKGTIHAGDVQWMTAGRGIVHSEMPAGGGTNTGLQLWINLASKDKMIEPRYQELLSEDIPKAEKDGVEVKTEFSIPSKHPGILERLCIHNRRRRGVRHPNSQPVTAHHILVLGPGEGLSVWNKSSKTLRFILVGGLPLNEPVVQHGPFVMNTQAEIDNTIEDYYYAKNGFEMSRQWRSK
ncbi:UNVERIFIED_CONTAM: Pirin-like protein [Sesamum latifolium]|uniref:Pirin-like protein n=1 Tax=Sesamum latifolium TaxID=2727402 RepID=A0AAW2VYR9_9LAMI